MRQTTRLRELLRSGRSLVVPGCYNALSGAHPRRGGIPRGVHDGLRHVAVAPRDAGRRPRHDDRDAPERALHRGRRLRARHRGRRQRLRQCDQRDPHGPGVRGHGRRRHPHRGPGHPQALRARGRPAGHPDRGGRGQVPRGGTGAGRGRSRLRPDRPHRRARRARRQPGRGHPPRQCLSRGGRGHGLRGGADERRRGAPHLPRGQGPDLLQPDRRVAAALPGADAGARHRHRDPARRRAARHGEGRVRPGSSTPRPRPRSRGGAHRVARRAIPSATCTRSPASTRSARGKRRICRPRSSASTRTPSAISRHGARRTPDRAARARRVGRPTR